MTAIKAEGRNPKAERRPVAQVRTPNPKAGRAPSGFRKRMANGFNVLNMAPFGFWPSVYGRAFHSLFWTFPPN
jgi:hypothetical protein